MRPATVQDPSAIVKATLPPPAALAVHVAEAGTAGLFRKISRDVQYLGTGQVLKEERVLRPEEFVRPLLWALPLPAPAKSSLTPTLRAGFRVRPKGRTPLILR
jgi:hypothetical protein